MTRALAFGLVIVVVVVVVGCGDSGKVAPPPPAGQPKASEIFDKKESDMPKNAKKQKAKPGGE